MKIVRKTKSVEILNDVFKSSSNAFSVVDLIDRFKEDMNKTTIYRILDKLEQDGVVHSFLGIDGLKWYAKCHDCSSHSHFDTHPHFQCQKCGKLDCLSTNITIPSIPNREIDFAQVLLVGKCDKCIA
ncbi:MAG: transcriptional repressor [Vicingaceae bacterium]|nr:transcriptional repressor [Vicingaceae bacterium]